MAVDLSSFAGKYPQSVLDAVQKIFAAKPDQEQAFTNDYNGDLGNWLNAFQSWWSSNGPQVAGNLAQFEPEVGLLDALGYKINPQAIPGGTLNPNGGVPLEQGILKTVLPGLVNQITGDQGRQSTVNTLTNQTNAAYGNLANVLGQAQAHFDGAAYFKQNPDVAAEYQRQGGQQGTGMTIDQFAEKHYNESGKNEGRAPTYTSTALQQQQGNASTAANATIAAAQGAANSQLAALQSSIGSMQQNLQGNLAAKAQALQTAIGSLNQNLDKLDGSQKANLAAQIQTMQKDLEDSIASQRQALTTEVQQLQGNASQAAAARRAALEQEIQQLATAQGPLNQARLQGAEALSTAVNLGLQSTKDQIAANAAREGFVGPSSFTDAALARAGIDARQQAAQAVTGARTANAEDTRQIGILGATKGYSIADTLAGEQQQAGNLGATGGARLSAALAQGTQGLGDFGATGLRQIGDTTAGARATIGNNAASQTYNDTVGGANDTRSIQDMLSKGGYDIANVLAQQTQGAKNNQAAANFAAGSQLFPQSVNAAQSLAVLPGAQAQTLTSLLPYGNAGTNNALGVLNWWGTNNATPPNPNVTLTNPSQVGNQTASLGTGLLGSAFQIGNANKWWTGSKPDVPAGVIPPGSGGDV